MDRRSFVAVMGGGVLAEALVVGAPGVRRTGAWRQTDTGVAAWHAERRFAETRFGRIAYVERGGGRNARDAALFLHGFPLNGFQWRGAVDRLSAHQRCVVPDFLALGYSEVAAGQSVAPESQAAMLIALIDALGITRVHVVANDSGGAIAQLLIRDIPERVRSVLLTNCDTELDSPPAALKPVIDMARAGTYADRWLAPWVADKALARSATGLGGLTYTFPDRLADETIDCYLAPLVASAARKELVNSFAVALERNPLEGIASALRRSVVPARIVWGTGDDIFSSTSPDYLARTFRNSRGVRRVVGARLFFPEEFPDIIAEEARQLWSGA